MIGRYKKELEQLRAGDALRVLRNVSYRESNIVYRGKEMLNLSSNDYLGIGSDACLWQDFLTGQAGEDEFGGGSCSSRLLTGNFRAYASLESRLARLYNAESALVFASGYHANVGILPAVADPKDLILADKLVHASLIDGIRLSRAQCIRFEHNNMEKLESILEKERDRYENVFIATESVFSMDGDFADLDRLVALKKKYRTFLYVDEAHALGVYSAEGLGLCGNKGIMADVDFLVGTFGKAVASQGAFVITCETFREYLINTMRSLIFSTALPPVSVMWTEFAMNRIVGMNKERQYLEKISGELRKWICDVGLKTAGESHIVPVIVGSNAEAVGLSEFLCDNGYFALPIRTPTVPAGSERVRLSITAAMTENQMEGLSKAIKKYAERLEIGK